MAIANKFLPQLLTYEDDEAKNIVRNLKKIKIKNEYQLVDLGVNEYVSVPKLDGKAFRYVEKNGKLYLRESVYSVGGLVQDSVLINLGEFIEGENETGEGLEYLAKIKDAKAKQRQKQLRECERLAMSTLNQINKRVKNAELLAKWQNELKDAKMFVRLGKEDYYQSQIDLLAPFAKEDETLAKILVDYNTKINAKNEKWQTQPLKLGKVKDANTRIGTAFREGIGEINPENRQKFAKYYTERAAQMHEFVHREEEVTHELPVAPEIIYDKNLQIPNLQKAAEQSPQQQQQQQKQKSSQVVVSVQKLKQVFAQTTDPKATDETEMSR